MAAPHRGVPGPDGASAMSERHRWCGVTRSGQACYGMMMLDPGELAGLIERRYRAHEALRRRADRRRPGRQAGGSDAGRAAAHQLGRGTRRLSAARQQAPLPGLELGRGEGRKIAKSKTTQAGNPSGTRRGHAAGPSGCAGSAGRRRAARSGSGGWR